METEDELTPLADHLARVAEQGVLEFNLDAPVDDVDGITGFAVAATDMNGHVMIVEMSISRDGQGITAVVATYDPDGTGRTPAVHSARHQTMVTVDGDPNAC